jgi:hypothetical protein
MNSARVVILSFAALLAGTGALLSAADRAERPWVDQVGRDRDRGAGRIVDEPTWETSRLQEDRDVRLGRLEPRRDFDRFDEERDRRLQLDARGRAVAPSAARTEGSVILSQPPAASDGAVISSMASQVAADEQALADARDQLDRSLRAVNVAEQRALRLLRRRLTREGRPGEFEQLSGPIRQRHELLRAGHVADYERVRRRILGQKPAPPSDKR